MKAHKIVATICAVSLVAATGWLSFNGFGAIATCTAFVAGMFTSLAA